MKKTLFAGLILVLMVALACAQDIKQQQEEQQKAMEAYMKAAAVTENHQFLAKYAGDWDVAVTYWMGPGAPPTKSTGTFKGRMLLGGRYLEMTFNGFMMGQPFEGIQLVGFDNLEQKYNTLWIDNTSTSFFMTRGTREGDVLNETGEWPDPVTGSVVSVKARTTWVGGDEYLYEQWMVMPDGTEHKGMEMRCKQKK